jgi:signal transduction histidine kinase
MEVKSEHTFLEMINAAVSHELRNPLNSLIGQVEAMKEYFEYFKRVINEIKQNPECKSKLK